MGQITLKERFRIPRYDDPDQVRPGIVEFDYEKCSGCGLCDRICPANSIVMNDKRPEMVPLNKNGCIACAACTGICPEGAVVPVAMQILTGYYKSIDYGEFLGPSVKCWGGAYDKS